MVDKEINMFNLMHSIQKMKACVSILLKESKNPFLLTQAKKLYMNKQTLCLESDEVHMKELERESNKYTKFYDYMSADEEKVVDSMEFSIQKMMTQVL